MPGDAALGTVLRELRRSRQLTLAAVARRAGCAESQLSYVESGRRQLHQWLADQLDAIYQTGGVVAALVAGSSRQACEVATSGVPERQLLLVRLPGGGAPMPLSRRELLASLGLSLAASPALGRLEAALSRLEPTRASWHEMLEAFNGYQAAARVLPPSRLIDAMTGQVAILNGLRRRTRGQLRAEFLQLEARYAESLSWLSEEAGDAPGALFWTDRASEWAQGGGWAAMAAYAFVRRSMMAISFTSDGARAVDYARSAFELPGAPVRMQGLAAKQLAFGHALVWERDASARAIDVAMDLLSRPSEDGGELGQRSVVDDDLYAIYRATCDIYLGRGERAIAVLEPRLADLSSASARTATITRAKVARAYAQAGQPYEAARLADQALTDSASLQSLSATSELRRAADVLQQWHRRSDVRDVLQRLRSREATNA